MPFGQSLQNFIADQALRERCFTYSHFLDYAIAETKNFVLDPTAVTGGKTVRIIPFFVVANQGHFEMGHFAATDCLSDGTALSAFNLVQKIPETTPESVLQLNPTINSIGINFYSGIIPANQLWVSDINGLFFDIITAIKYTITVTNKSGVAARAQLAFSWLETTDTGF